MDFGEYRAMMLDFGVSPQAIDDMCLAEITSLMAGMSRRRGKVKPHTPEEISEGMSEFAAFVAHDPAVRLH